MFKGKQPSGNLILAVSLSISAVLACCVAVSCNALQNEQKEPSTQSSRTMEKLYVVVGEHGKQAFSYGEGKTHKDRIRSLVEHSLLSVEDNPYSVEYAALHSAKGLLYVVSREDVPGAVRVVAKINEQGQIQVEEE